MNLKTTRILVALIAGLLVAAGFVLAGSVLGLEPGVPTDGDTETAQGSPPAPAVDSLTWRTEPCDPGAGYVRVIDHQGSGRQLELNVSFRVDRAPRELSPDLQQDGDGFRLRLNPSGNATDSCRYLSLRTSVTLPDDGDALTVAYGNATVVQVGDSGAGASAGAGEG